jgi:pilus assembly protein CpaE
MPTDEKIKIMIVDDIADTRENIKRMVQFDQNIEVAGVARSGQEAVELTPQIKPEVIILDINMPDMDGITAAELIRKRLPSAQIVFLSVQNDLNYARRAMAVGARDFLSKPPNIEELIQAIQKAGAIAKDIKAREAQGASKGATVGPREVGGYFSSVDGKVIVVYSPKGGIGTTTVAINLALALNSPTKKTVIVDTNLQFGDVAVFINEQSKNSLLDLLVNVDELDTEIIQEVMTTNKESGLNILAAPIRPEFIEKANGEQVSKLFKFLKKIFSYVVVDTTPTLTQCVQGAIDASDLTILLANQEIPTIKNCHLFLSFLDSVDYPREKILFVMNKYNREVAISAEKIGENLKQPVEVSIPLEDKTAFLSVNRGKPFIMENKTLPISKAIMQLASKVNETIEKLEMPEAMKKEGKK